MKEEILTTRHCADESRSPPLTYPVTLSVNCARAPGARLRQAAAAHASAAADTMDRGAICCVSIGNLCCC